jgi:hypothetical protein
MANPQSEWMLLVWLGLAACEHSTATPKREAAMTDERSGAPAPFPAPSATAPSAVAAAPPSAAAPSAAVVDRELAIHDLNASAKVRVKLPAAWTEAPLSIVLRDEFQEAIAGVQFTVICDAGCGDAELARAAEVVEQTFETRARPNVNTGDPVMDAVRLKVEVVEQGDVAGGKVRVARITKPAGLEGPYREQLYAVCVRGEKGAKIVAAQAWAPLDRQGDLGPLIVTACKTFEIVP